MDNFAKKQRATVQAAIDSGVLNNTNRSHELVDFVAKLAADKGLSFNFADNAKLKETGFALEGVTVNGFVNASGVTVNIQSAKALNAVVGHEITHVLEGTQLYDALAQSITEYAKAKGEYQSRYDSLTKLYAGVENANVEAEVVADLVGDYLFTDKAFVQKLSTENRGLFRKIWDEVKYLCKVVTAGSKEARQLEKVKKIFEEAYKAQKTESKAESGTKYSLFLNQEDIPDYLKAGNRQNKNRQKRYEEGQQMVISTDAEFESFVKKAVEGNPNAMVAYGKVDDALAQQVKEKSNSQIDIENAYLELLSDDVQHAYREHAAAKEPGDMDMSVDDLIYALKNVNQAEVVSARQYKDGGQRVTLATPTDDGMMLLVEVASKSAGTLRLKTGWKTTVEKFEQKYRSDTSTTGSENSTNAVREDTASTDIVSGNPQNVKYSLSEQTQTDNIAPLPWQIKGQDVALEDIAPIGENVVTKQNTIAEDELAPVREDAVATPREYISLEDYANNESPVWRNVGYADEETKAAITQETHDRMVSSGAVVTVTGDVMGEVEKSFPDLRSMKKTERTPILKEAINKLKSSIRQFLTGLSNQNFEFEVNGKVLEAKLYSTGINEVLGKVTQEKANMLYSTEEIFRNAQYLYSTPDYDGDPNVYRWNYFYTPVQIGEEIVGVRIAVRDMAKGTDGATPQSQIYNWGIKKDASLDGGSHDPRAASSGVSSDASNNNIPQTPPNVNPDDSTGAAPSPNMSYSLCFWYAIL